MLEERWEARMAAQAKKERTGQVVVNHAVGVSRVDDNDIVVLDDGKDVRTHPGQQRRRCRILDILVLLLVVGGVAAVFLFLRDKEDRQVDGSQASAAFDAPSDSPSFSPFPIDPLLEELRSWIAPTREDLVRFLDPSSPQSQALAWLHNDPITSTPGRSTHTVLERYVLAVFYYSTSGPSWKFDYLSDEDVCIWNDGKSVTNSSEPMTGVYCVEGGESVGTLALSENKLRGTIPWELALLTSLEVIDVGLNSLTGSIPTRIIDPTNLLVIVVLWNELTGSIPAGISALTRLQGFWASENGLTGPFAPYIFSLHGCD
jgi:hypothetical protein